ncbi:MAG: hypothetical protein QOC87_67 [Actinomycetota bacterium]|nr:hypothetical protein [Actinomycetota bacterium]
MDDRRLLRTLRGKLRAVFIAAIVLTLVGSSSSAAPRTKPPETALRVHNYRIASGERGSYCWGSSNQGVCSSVDYIADWHPRFRRMHRGRAQVRAQYGVRPRRARVCAQRFQGGHEVGRCRRLDMHIRKAITAHGRRWDLCFVLPRPGSYRLDTTVHWRKGDWADYAFGATVVPSN